MSDSFLMVWIILPLLIFVARILDMTFDTLRIIFVMRGSTLVAALLGFVEAFVWIIVVREILNHQGFVWLHFVAYSAGFAAGNVIGIKVEARLALGLQTIRVITSSPTETLERAMIEQGYWGTKTSATGLRGGAMTLLFSTLPRRQVAEAIQLIESHLKSAFISVEDIKSVNERPNAMLMGGSRWRRLLSGRRPNFK